MCDVHAAFTQCNRATVVLTFCSKRNRNDERIVWSHTDTRQSTRNARAHTQTTVEMTFVEAPKCSLSKTIISQSDFFLSCSTEFELNR